MKPLIFLKILLFSLLIGCSKEREVSRLLVTFNLESAGDKLVQPITSSSAYWGAAGPSSASEINCFAVLVAYDDTETSDTQCYRLGDTSPYLTIKLAGGMAANGDSFQLEVPQGESRTFYAIGIKSAGSCDDITSLDSTQKTYLSEPLILGQTTEEISGFEQEVSITGSFTGAQSIYRCSGDAVSWYEPSSGVWNYSLWDGASWGP
jgi:hypothetical protein